MDPVVSSVRPKPLTGIGGFDWPREGRQEGDTVGFSLHGDLFFTADQIPFSPQEVYLKVVRLNHNQGQDLGILVTFDMNQVYLSKQRKLTHKESQVALPPPDKTNPNATW